MKKAILLSFLLLAAMIVPFMEGAEGLTISSEFALQLDPANDVVEVEEGGTQSKVTGHDEIDILSAEAVVDPGSITAGPLKDTDDVLLLTMNLKGDVVDDDEDVKYFFAMVFPGDTYIVLCNYSSARSNFACYVVSLEEGGEPFTTAQNPSVTGNSFTVRISLLALGTPSSVSSLRAGSADARNEEKKYADLAPDKLVKITSPSEGSTIWHEGTNMYTFTGACHKSTDAFTSVQIKIDNGPWMTPTIHTSEWETWSMDMNVAGLSGQHSISARGTAGGVEYIDTLYFSVGNPGDTFNDLPALKVGDVYKYGTANTAVIAELDVQIDAMTITIEKLEEITIGSNTYNCFKVHTFESASLEASILEIEQNVNRDSWRIADDFETQQSIVKEYTHTSQSALRSGSPLNSANTYTNLTYDAPFDPGYLHKEVGEWWSVTASGAQTSRAVDSEDEEKIKNTSPVKTAYNEILRTEMVSLPNSLGGGSEDCFIIKTSNGDNETPYSESAYSEKYPVPVRIEFYDGNRELIGSLVLEDREVGPGTYFEITSVSDPPTTIEAGVKVSVDITVENKGDSAGVAWVALDVNGEEKANESSGSIEPGASATITLSWTPKGSDVGPADLQVAGQNSNVVVGGITIKEAPETNNMLIYALIAAVAVVAISLAVAVKRRGEKKLLDEHDEKMAGGPALEAPMPAKEVSIESGEVVIEAAPAMSGEDKLKSIIGEKTPVQCGKCSATTQVVIDEKPYKFKCPECGAKLLIR